MAGKLIYIAPVDNASGKLFGQKTHGAELGVITVSADGEVYRLEY